MVSVILTSFRRPRLVQEAIRSVLVQTYEDWELVLVDDNSGGETLRAIASVVDGHPRVRILETRVRESERLFTCRYAVAINMGIEAAHGSLITYLTDDDRYLPHRLTRMVCEFELHPERMIVYGDQRVLDLLPDGSERLRAVRGTFGVTQRPERLVDHCSVMHRRNCLDQMERPYWPEEARYWAAADAVFWAKLATRWPFYPIDEVLDEHRWHRSNIQTRMIEGFSPIYTHEI